VPGAVLHQVTDEPQVRLRLEQPFLLGDVLLEDVGLQRAVEGGDIGPLALVVIEVVTSAIGMPENRMSMSAAESIATPQCPTSPAARGSSESRPMSVGMSKATESPVPPAPRSILYRSLVWRALPNPENWRIVQARPR
jgi:hypothetical protein